MFGFFKKKKEKEPEITVNSADMGELTWGEGTWSGKCTVLIYGKPTEIDLWVNTYDDEIDEPISVQEECFRYYREHENELNDKIEKVLLDEYELDDASLVRSRFQPAALILNPNEACGLAFRDFEESEGSSEAVIVVEVLPEVEYAGSIEGYD